MKKGDKVKLLENISNLIRKYKKGEVGKVIEPSHESFFEEEKIQIKVEFEDGARLIYDKEKFKVVSKYNYNDRVIYSPQGGFDKFEAIIFGVAEKEDAFGEQYAISYYNEIGRFVNNLALESELSPAKKLHQLEEGDKFKQYAGHEYIVLASGRDEYNYCADIPEYYCKQITGSRKGSTKIIPAKDIEYIIYD